MKLKFFVAALLFVAAGTANAQLRYGFKTGLNFANISGPLEKGASGNALEKFSSTTGFHIGVTLGYKFTDNFGIRGEVLYSKKGTQYTFNGPSYYMFRNGSSTKMSTGTSNYLINLTNAYFDVPVVFYTRFKSLEFSAGVYGGILIQSIADGNFTYSGAKTVPLGNPIYSDANGNGKYDAGEDLEFALDYNYRKDGAGKGVSGSEIAKVDGGNITLNKTVGAYYEYASKSGNLYNSFDYGLVGGISYYLSSALYISGRVQYGLSDITNNKVDRYRTIPAGVQPKDFTTPVLSADKDRNFVIQASVGFSF
jgi:hypothetical protein